MEEKDRLQIEKHFARELNPREQSEFEQRVNSDSQFAAEFEEYKNAMEALKLAQRDELKNRFRARDKELDKDIDKSIITSANNIRYIWLLAAFFIFAVLGIWLLNSNNGQGAEDQIVIPQDTSTIHQITTPKDTSAEKEIIPMASEETKDIDKWNTTEYDGAELFAENFEPYTDESMESTVRGDEELTADELFIKSYVDGEYDVTIEAYGEMDPGYQQNDGLRFIYANALMANGLVDESILQLKDIIKNNNSNYITEAKFYLGLAYLKKKNYSEAKKHLATYSVDAKAQQKEKAKRILMTIK